MPRKFEDEELGQEPEDWTTYFRTTFDRMRKKKELIDVDENVLQKKLRSETLTGWIHLRNAAEEDGHPDYMLRTFTVAARIAGLMSPDVAVGIQFGGAEALPDLSHLSDEELSRLSNVTPALEAPKEPSGKAKRKA